MPTNPYELHAALDELRRDLAAQADEFDLRRQPSAGDALRTVAARLAEIAEESPAARPLAVRRLAARRSSARPARRPQRAAEEFPGN